MRLILLFLLLSACTNDQSQSDQTETPKATEANVQEVTEPEFQFDMDYVMGKFDFTEHPDFEVIPASYSNQADRYLRKDALADFIRMYDAAKADGINLQIISAARNFNYQKGIWERKWNGDYSHFGDSKERALKILEYSSMPSTSRHHWGTDIDLNSFENSYFESGQGLEEYEWLVANAATFGYCQVYSEKGADRPNGYNLEKWHWSYMPVSRHLLEVAKKEMKDEMISGFQGAETAVEIGVVEKYILGISPACN